MHQSQKHHYIPQFYLKRWADNSGRLTEFSIPYDKVVTRLRYPSETGFKRNLYRLEKLSKQDAQWVESNFFSPADSQASDALRRLEQSRYDDREIWPLRLRSAWSRFLLSLQLRLPEDVRSLYDYWSELVLSLTTEYQQSDETIGVHYDDDQSFAQLWLGTIDSEFLGSHINNMSWSVVDLCESSFDLLTSDNPVIMPHGLNSDDSHIALPIGPRKLFVAAKRAGFLHEIADVKASDLVKSCNQQVVERATNLVFATNRSQLRFVTNRFGANRERRVIERRVTEWKENGFPE